MADNSNKIILDLCGGTGAWSKPYKDAGYDVRVITLPDYDVTEVSLNCWGCLDFKDKLNHCWMTVWVDAIYGILAAPPCTEFSVAKANNPRDLNGAMQIVKACMNIIWQCRLFGKPKFWAMENPRGLLRQFLGVPHFTFEHWQFGDEGCKPTDLWGYYKSPKCTVMDKPANLTTRYPNGHTAAVTWGNPKCPPEYADLGLCRADIRAITPAGFAQAFYRANQ